MSEESRQVTVQGGRALEQGTYHLNHPIDETSWSVRENLHDILERELLGPSDGEDELIIPSPVTKYIIGRIAPTKLEDPEGVGESDIDRRDPEADDEDLAHEAESDEPETDGEDDPTRGDGLQKSGLMIPASMGLRFQVPASLSSITVKCSWGMYNVKDTGNLTASGRKDTRFRRTPCSYDVNVPLGRLTPGETHRVSVVADVLLLVDVLPENNRNSLIVEIALCNDRITPRRVPVEAWMFQTSMEVVSAEGAVFLPVSDFAMSDGGTALSDSEVSRLRLQYRDRLEFAVGRTCSADWDVEEGARTAKRVRTTWLPVAEVPQTSAASVEGALLDMEALASAEEGELESGLRPIASAYGDWLDAQDAMVGDLPTHLRDVAREAIKEARQVERQISDGIDLLLANTDALRSFRFMNRVMADQRVHSQVAQRRIADPDISLFDAEQGIRTVTDKNKFPHHWRVFQIAFILMQLRSIIDPSSESRSDRHLARAQLLFFPTGGGKTEAYLGLAAYSFAARRLQGTVHTPDGDLDGSAGVTVIMRYTLRLLTSQQFQRASTLMCAAELERMRHPEVWGDVPFRLGLWVGTNVTPKTVKAADEEVRRSNSHGGYSVGTLQLATCPWCGRPLGPGDVHVEPVEGRVRVFCSDDTGECPFSEGGEVEDGIPVLTTDEEIYRLVPSFVIATVDKFARLSREGQASALFGYVGRKCERHGYVPMLDASGGSDYQECTVKDGGKHPRKGKFPAASVHPCNRLRPPDLIIQDELHLITGALGTTVGLFETVVDLLCTWKDAEGKEVRPLVIASTATARNATSQIRQLYARGTTMFPPQVLDASDTFFSKDVPPDKEHPGRRYVGVSTTGVRVTAAEIRVAEALMAGAQLMMDRAGELADPYMTLVGYFSATRELAGMARYMQDDIATNLRRSRMGENSLPRRYGTIGIELNLGELTSRISSTQILRTLGDMGTKFSVEYDGTAARMRRMEQARRGERVRYRSGRDPLDVVLATSMLQVGVDVPRLGLMLVAGQPKNTAEYIQATSRVGRDPGRPGLVVCVGNWARPRDLAHYEQFRAYHESFYAKVEPLSVTPFSVTSIDRGVDLLLTSAARVMTAHDKSGGLSPESGAGSVEAYTTWLESLADRLVERVGLAAPQADATNYIRQCLDGSLQSWRHRRQEASKNSSQLVYERSGSSDSKERLIRSPEDSGGFGSAMGRPPFVVANSMREVQPEVNLLVSPDPYKLAYRPKGAPKWESQDTKNDQVTEGDSDGGQ